MAKVGYPFRTIEREFEFVEVRYCPLKKNTSQPGLLFELYDLQMVNGKLTSVGARVRPYSAQWRKGLLIQRRRTLKMHGIRANCA